MLPSVAANVTVALLKLEVLFPRNPGAIEQIALRWVHIVAGIIWLGFLYYLVLAAGPMLDTLDPATRAKVFPAMRRGAWWLRWGALVSWLAGFRYFMILAQNDASVAGRPQAWGEWLGIWFGCWLFAFAIEMALVNVTKGVLGNRGVAILLVLFLMTATSWLVVSLLAQPGVGNATLSIAIGGGLGTILLFNIWGIVWRCQKRLFAWTYKLAEEGTPMPPEAFELARVSALTMQINFWLSFPMVFFMAAAAHFPFLFGGG
jgi:uncharacterized membrane protein